MQEIQTNNTNRFNKTIDVNIRCFVLFSLTRLTGFGSTNWSVKREVSLWCLLKKVLICSSLTPTLLLNYLLIFIFVHGNKTVENRYYMGWGVSLSKMKERMNEGRKERTDERTDGRTDEQTNKQASKQTNKWKRNK